MLVWLMVQSVITDELPTIKLNLHLKKDFIVRNGLYSSGEYLDHDEV